MSGARKCNRCAALFEPRAHDLVILDMHEYVMPNPRLKDKPNALHERSIFTESENECDLCAACSNELRDFLKPIQRPVVKP